MLKVCLRSSPHIQATTKSWLQHRTSKHWTSHKHRSHQLCHISQFWWKGSDRNDDESNSATVVSVVNQEPNDSSGDNDKNSLVPRNGENSPKLNPLLILPTRARPIFPGFMSSVLIKDEKTIDALSKKLEDSAPYIGIFLRKQLPGEKLEYPEIITSASQIYKVGSFAQITNLVKTDVGLQVLLMGHRRVTLGDINSWGPPVNANVIHWKRPDIAQSQSLKAYCNEVLSAARELIKLNPLSQELLQQYIARIDLGDPFKLADFAAAMTTADGVDLQRVLEAVDPIERLAITLELLTKEREIVKLQREITKQVEEKMNKQQREYLLKEQLKSIKQELGIEKDDKDELIGKYTQKIQAFESKEFANKSEIMRVINEEVKKMSTLEKNSPEFNVTRAYLDWLTAIPHGHINVDRLILKAARAVLDRDHFGLDEIKKRILEFIAVGKLQGTVAGKIICFIGPPGVGKTSIAKSIAAALNRSFYRFSVGGLTDIAEIKGHRRTYIGAMPGKPIQCLRNTGCMNPLILIDEIDKVGKGYQGDPASALLELLDPNQNGSFVDHYLDVPIDFSNVLFVCTANDESTIPGPLRDRMEIIRLSGYDIPEKVSIASQYLVPKALKESGLTSLPAFQVTITEHALELLVKNYCRESGVRSLEKHIEKIARKIAFEAVGDSESDLSADDLSSDGNKVVIKDQRSIVVTGDNLEKYLGKARFTQDTIYDGDKDDPLPVGVVMGLAWNPLGGSPVFVETAALPTQFSETGGGITSITGQLGSVMKESVNIAYTFSRKFIADRSPDNLFFKSHSLHIHVPEGAVEKDGPSAGITMATSLISIATGRAIKARTAMTGELSLTGKVLPVGGIKEKTLAAKRSGAKTVILPLANKRDYDELPQYVKDDVSVHFVGNYEDVYAIAFDI